MTEINIQTVDVTEDQILGGRVRLLQPAQGYRTAIDGILLAAAVDATPKSEILDLGAGVGTVGLCLVARQQNVGSIIGVEQNSQLCNLARKNALINSVAEKVHVLEANIRDQTIMPSHRLFDQVMMNPPYLRQNQIGRRSSNLLRQQALYENGLSLDDWLKIAWNYVKSNGTITLIHLTQRLPDIFGFFDQKTCSIKIYPLWAGPHTQAKRLIIQITKGRKNPFEMCRGLVLHQESGHYSVAAENILRHAQPILWK